MICYIAYKVVDGDDILPSAFSEKAETTKERVLNDDGYKAGEYVLRKIDLVADGHHTVKAKHISLIERFKKE